MDIMKEIAEARARFEARRELDRKLEEAVAEANRLKRLERQAA